MRGIDVAPSATNHELHVGRTFAIGLERLDLERPGRCQRPCPASAARASWCPTRPSHASCCPPPWASIGPDTSRAQARRAGHPAPASRWAFLNTNDAMVFIHPLVAAFARRIDATRSRRVAPSSGRCWPVSRRATQPTISRRLRNILPHFRQLADAALGRNDDAGGAVCVTPSRSCWRSPGDLPGGIPYFERARAISPTSRRVGKPSSAPRCSTTWPSGIASAAR